MQFGPLVNFLLSFVGNNFCKINIYKTSKTSQKLQSISRMKIIIFYDAILLNDLVTNAFGNFIV